MPEMCSYCCGVYGEVNLTSTVSVKKEHSSYTYIHRLISGPKSSFPHMQYHSCPDTALRDSLEEEREPREIVLGVEHIYSSRMAVFVDLNITNCTEVKTLQSIIEMAAHLGYSAVAINHVVDMEKKKMEVGKPISPADLFPSLPIVQGKSTPIKILTRLTIIASDSSHYNVVRSTSPLTRLYDIVAVYPKTEKLFHAACTSIDVDLICINVTEKCPFFIRRPSVNVAIERGFFFELIYTPAIKDSTLRRYAISNALSLMQVCKGKNIIISSAAEKPLELRGPYDVATLGLLFGMSESAAKAALSVNCRSAILHGETRKTAFGVTRTVKKPKSEEYETATVEPVSKKAKKE